MAIIRNPSAAGRFYPRFKGELLDTIHENFVNSSFGLSHDLNLTIDNNGGDRKVLGGVSPHAGYIYSGSATAHTIQEVFGQKVPDTVIILGTQHTGYYEIGIMKEGAWKTPFGTLDIDTDLAIQLLKESKVVKEDDSAFNGFPHGREHNIEVQIPFIQYAATKAQKSVKILPIKIGKMNQNVLETLGKDIASVLDSNNNKDIAIIASSDMTHYQPQNPRNPKEEILQIQHKRDEAVMEAFEQFNWQKTLEKATDTSVCGPQCIATLMIIGKEMGYTTAKKLQYYTSYEKIGGTGPSDYSVGYFSGIISR
ncbi:AmmeMemoRadiSam system protein B [Candidatus Lokiarchaeum ossiferum]|uniref:AmmeMemoRadiSam system protein B n=1 Tax=Candidatus Lokiarchaeum ossiferum TaxID=2951803 RepID=UPI00352FAF72